MDPMGSEGQYTTNNLRLNLKMNKMMVSKFGISIFRKRWIDDLPTLVLPGEMKLQVSAAYHYTEKLDTHTNTRLVPESSW